MCMGVATANSILVVSFAKERLEHHGDAIAAAIEAGSTRFRPVIMTALAMIIGMIPMALGLGEGGEQNAPLGRAVIGGLLCATVATLVFVPAVFSLLHGQRDSQDSQPVADRDQQPPVRPVRPVARLTWRPGRPGHLEDPPGLLRRGHRGASGRPGCGRPGLLPAEPGRRQCALAVQSQPLRRKPRYSTRHAAPMTAMTSG